jgi:hypothetical protein
MLAEVHFQVLFSHTKTMTATGHAKETYDFGISQTRYC